MLSRALSLATVTLLIGCFSMMPAQAQAQNLEAGKSPSQIFAGTCNACHKSPRGLLKTVAAGSLPSFLRQHYTTSSEMASLLSSFLVSNGATDSRYVGAQPRPKSEARPSGPPEQLDRFGRRLRPPAPQQEAAKPDAEPPQAARPDADGLVPQAEPGRQGRNAKRLARPGEAPDAAKPAADGQAPAQAAFEHQPDGRKLPAKQKLSKRGKPSGEEPPKSEAAKSEAAKSEAAKSEAAKSEAAKGEGGKTEPAKGEAAKDDQPRGETARDEGSKPEGTKPSGESKSESAKIEAPKETGSETPALRADPVPPVTPAPPASTAVSAAVSGGTPEPVMGTPALAQSAPPAMTASVPPPPPIAPAGPPAPPISQ
jgi:hypothetical protein